MKYFVILILLGLVAITSVNGVYGLWMPETPDELFKQSETVFVGNITSVNVLEFERSTTHHIEENGIPRIEIENYTQTLDEYTVNIEEFLKNPQTSNTITMLEATVGGVPGRSVSIGGFELGDSVLFYVPNIDGTNQYSPESFKIPKQCDAKSVLEQSRVFLFNDFKIMQDGIIKNDNFVANKPIEFVYNKDMDALEGKNFDVGIKISKITGNDWETALDEKIHTKSNPCEWVSTASWDFVPTAGRYYMWMNATEGDRGGETSSRGFTVKEFDFPLKQFKSGILIDEIQCKENLVLIQKYDGFPACVKPETIPKLIERGWMDHLDAFAYPRIENPEDVSADRINWKKHVTVSASKIKEPMTFSVNSIYNIDNPVSNPVVLQMLNGADRCKDRIEVCIVSHGVSLVKFYLFGIAVNDSDEYSVTIDQDQAKQLLSEMKWTISKDLIYSVVSWNAGHYLLVLSTFDDARMPDVAMKLVDVSPDPVSLERKSTLKYTIQVNTWATYGADAKVVLDAFYNARDSGIETWVEPHTLIIPERSSVNATLFIHAPETSRDGIYDIRVIGKANGNYAGLYCGTIDCPTVRIGDSDWSISTFGSDSGMSMGRKESPEDSTLEIELGKKDFFKGEIMEIKAYIANNSTEPLVLDSSMNLLIKAIRADSAGYYGHFYGIDARYESDNSITIEPGSRILLARPFYWDQMTFEGIDDEHRIESGLRKMTANFSAGESSWSNDAWFEIK